MSARFPVLAIVTKDGRLFYHDVSLGNSHGMGGGWLRCLPWGEAREVHFSAPDNTVGIDHDDVADAYIIAWTTDEALL